MPTLTFIFADGETVSVPSRTGETILQAARRGGLGLSSDCEVGDCQTCRCNIRVGEVDYDELATVSLTDAEMRAGETLACVAEAAGDVTLQMPYERGRLIPAKPFSMRIEAAEQVAAGTVRLRAQTLGLKPVQFLPGQYVNVTVPGSGAVRSYSMASAPSAERRLEFFVRLLDGGAMTEFLTAHAQPGGVLECEGPRGTFYLRDGDRPLLMLAGGTGLAPMLAMLRTLAAQRSSRAVLLCFGVNTQDQLFGLDEIAGLQAVLPGLELRVTVAGGEPGPGRISGYVTQALRPGEVQGRDIYLCGPPAMTDAARALLARHGAGPDRIFMERFAPTGEAVPAEIDG